MPRRPHDPYASQPVDCLVLRVVSRVFIRSRWNKPCGERKTCDLADRKFCNLASFARQHVPVNIGTYLYVGHGPTIRDRERRSIPE